MTVENNQLGKKNDLEALHLLIQSDLELIRFELKDDILEMQSKLTLRLSIMFSVNIIIIGIVCMRFS